MKPWLDKTWLSHRFRVLCRNNVGGDEVMFHGEFGEAVARKEDCDLAAAAPEMCRALLVVEWAGHHPSYGAHCVSCQADVQWSGPSQHDSDCKLDAALTKAGLDTQEKRNEARKEMGL